MQNAAGWTCRYGVECGTLRNGYVAAVKTLLFFNMLWMMEVEAVRRSFVFMCLADISSFLTIFTTHLTQLLVRLDAEILSVFYLKDPAISQYRLISLIRSPFT